MRLLLLPLDERPVNTSLPADIATLFGVELALPPADALPHFRTAGDTAGLATWLVDQAPDADAALVSVDMLVHGGLIASRTSADELPAVIARLATLDHPTLHREGFDLIAVSVVTRNPPGGSVEEPDYWFEHGDALHEHGIALHRHLLEGTPAGLPASLTEKPEVRTDWALRRLRNHQVNLHLIDLFARGRLDVLLITSDDTAPVSIGTAERDWIEHWARALGLLDGLRRVGLQPGADELGCVMLSRAVLGRLPGERPTMSIHSAQPEGMERVAPFENRPAGVATRAQVEAAGAGVVERYDATPGDRHVALVVHAPAPAGEGLFDHHRERRADADATADLVEQLLDDGYQVALADIRHPNGSDVPLAEQVIDRGLVGRLAAYGAWNTAGNTLGAVIATSLAAAVSDQPDRQQVQQRLVVHRLLEDFVYMSQLREQFWQELPPDRLGAQLTDERAAGYAHRCQQGFDAQLARLGLDATYRVTRIRFPWRRLFEVDFVVEPR